MELSYEPGILLPGIQLQELKGRSQTDKCTPMFTVELFTIDKRWKVAAVNFNVHLQMNGQPKCGTYLQWNISINSEKALKF